MQYAVASFYIRHGNYKSAVSLAILEWWKYSIIANSRADKWVHDTRKHIFLALEPRQYKNDSIQSKKFQLWNCHAFSRPIRWGKKSENFKIGIIFYRMEFFLFFLCSSLNFLFWILQPKQGQFKVIKTFVCRKTWDRQSQANTANASVPKKGTGSFFQVV